MEEAKAGATVARLTELWLETRDTEIAIALIDARIAAERASEVAELSKFWFGDEADRGAADR